ncbi:MAG TPA: amidohydrolase family protein, partial [Methanoculleus sp.]|nr:amidohydrolase family protein [Methanoculleus sp.]
PLFAIDRELDWYEIAVMTRAGQAQTLGIQDLGKGHLAPGADADVAIYPIRIDEVDPSAEFQKVIDGFSRTEYTIKRGRVVARRGECVVHGSNATIWVRPKVSENYDMGKDPDFVEKFDRYYTVRMSNYPVQESYLSRSRCIETETEL